MANYGRAFLLILLTFCLALTWGYHLYSRSAGVALSEEKISSSPVIVADQTDKVDSLSSNLMRSDSLYRQAVTDHQHQIDSLEEELDELKKKNEYLRDKLKELDEE